LLLRRNRTMNEIPRMTNTPHAAMHGKLGKQSWLAPRLITWADELARPGYQSMKAHEYEDEESVLVEKVKLVAELLRRSKNTVCYTGAGLDVSAGVSDYASKANSKALSNQKRKPRSVLDCEPQVGHKMLVSLFHAKLLHHWIQQNHSGLPQKAGFPQEACNEIHGAWFDPSNPVVPMEGTLRSENFSQLQKWASKAELVLAIGTSLCGMSADCVVEETSKRFSSLMKHQFRSNNNNNNIELSNPCFGSVIIGFQRTQYDEKSSVRIFSDIDKFSRLLAKELGLTIPSTIPQFKVKNKYVVRPNVYKVPYDAKGEFTKNRNSMQEWNLNVGASVEVTSGPGKGFVGTIDSHHRDRIRVRLPAQREGSRLFGSCWQTYTLGKFWINSAVEGRIARLPIVNTNKTPMLRRRSKNRRM